VYHGDVHRVQIHLDDELDSAAAEEAARQGISKAALIRAALARELERLRLAAVDNPWQTLTGWLDDEPVDDIDEFLYGPSRTVGGGRR
jgi:hypothetical protein